MHLHMHQEVMQLRTYDWIKCFKEHTEHSAFKDREREKKRKPPPSFNLALFRKARKYFIFSFLLKNDQVGETLLAAALKEGRNSTN